MAAMGQYSHVQSGTGNTGNTTSSRPPGRLRLFDVTVMAMRAELATIAFWRAVTAECLASLLHVLFGCLATLTCPGPREPSAHNMAVALCFGLTVASLVQCFQHISGAHLNPVVSLVQAVTCKVTPLRALFYALAQTGGAVAGASILHGITTGSCQSELGVTVLHYGLSPWQGLGIEILLTFLLVFTICATVDPNRSELANRALLTGLCVTGCHLAGYRFTGSSMNPARSLGPAFVANNWRHHWVYWAGPLLGGVAAGLLYEFIFDPSRTRSRSHAPPSLDAEDGLMTTTTSLTTANQAHISTPRHYYNSASAVVGSSNVNSNNMVGSPRSCRRDNASNNNSSSNFNNSGCVTTNTTTTPNHYVPGTYGERALIDIRDTRPPPNDVTLQAPPVPRRNDVASVRRVQGQADGMTYARRHNPDDVTPGRENQAYSFDSNPRRLQSPSLSNPQRNPLNLFDDGRETICLNDVRVF